MPYFTQFILNNGVFITTRIISCFSHLFYQTLDLLQISIYARSVQRRLAFLIPLVPLRNNQSKNWWRRQKQRWYDYLCKGTTVSPFLLSSSLTPSCHNPPTHHLENIQKNHIRQTKSELIRLQLAERQNSSSQSERLTPFTRVWEDDVAVIERFTVVHLLLFVLFTIAPFWMPALSGTQLPQPRLSVIGLRRAASSLKRQPEPQHMFLLRAKVQPQNLAGCSK